MATITDELKKQLFSQESEDPFLTLVTLTHPNFTIRLANNSSDVTSNGFVFTAFPMKVTFPVDDGESSRVFTIEFDNVSLDLITQFRSVTGNIGVQIDSVLASMPDVLQISNVDLFIGTISYTATSISASIILDNFLAVGMTGERYLPDNFPGVFT